MTIRFNPKGYKPTKRERIEQEFSNFEQKVGKALNYYNAGEISEKQFISDINVAHSNYKRNQRNIYNSEDKL